MTEFGPEIPLDGKRPDWLTDDNQIIAFEDDKGDWYGLGLSIWYARELDIERPRALRLPHDHPYYTATEKGFTYWPGGETPPADVGDKILFRNGIEAPGPAPYCYWTHDNAPGDIIGYRRAIAQVDDTVQVKRMTESEALELWGDLTKSIDSFELDFVTGLKRLGLIKPEPTRLERFLASTNDPTIEAALEFERG